jgi:hypothetical protein
MQIFHPHFSPDITLGHLLQAVVVVVAGGGGILSGYLSLRSDIDVGHETRLAQAERELNDFRREDRQFQTEMRASLARVMEAIAELRTELVQKQNRR